MRDFRTIIVILCISLFATACSAKEYVWTNGMTVNEAASKYEVLYEQYPMQFDKSLISEDAAEYIEKALAKAKEHYRSTWGEELPDEFNSLVGYAEYYPAGESLFAVYWVGLAGAQEETYLDIHLIAEDSDTPVFAMETPVSDVRLVGDGEQLYILHSDGILSAIGTDGRVRELYDARVVTADTEPMPEYADLHLDAKLSGEGVQLICEPSFRFESDGDGFQVRYDRIVYDVENNELIIHEQGELSPL